MIALFFLPHEKGGVPGFSPAKGYPKRNYTPFLKQQDELHRVPMINHGIMFLQKTETLRILPGSLIALLRKDRIWARGSYVLAISVVRMNFAQQKKRIPMPFMIWGYHR